jgi:hypothetical protein
MCPPCGGADQRSDATYFRGQLLKREQDAKQDSVAQENIQLKEKLKPFEGVDVSEIGMLKEELKVAKAQNENLRSSNAALLREREQAKAETVLSQIDL